MKIETYSLFEFCQKVQEAIIAGWRFDFESNENFPTAFGSMLVAGMKQAELPKEDTESIATEIEEVKQEVKQEVKRGRKPKE